MSDKNAGDPNQAHLTNNMMRFDQGLRDLAEHYRDEITLIDADPITFGAGHYVLIPENNPTQRFTVEEQYTDTDWRDDERVPTSWTWTHQRHLRTSDTEWQWVVMWDGQVPSHRFEDLLHLAHSWAKVVHLQTHGIRPPTHDQGRDLPYRHF